MYDNILRLNDNVSVSFRCSLLKWQNPDNSHFLENLSFTEKRTKIILFFLQKFTF